MWRTIISESSSNSSAAGARRACSASILALALVVSTSAAAKLTYTLQPGQIQPGERARLAIEIPLKDLNIKVLDDDSELPQVRDDLLTDSKAFHVLDRDFRRERDALVWTYDVTAYESGKISIPPVEIRLGPLSFSSEAMPLEVSTKRAANDEALRDDFGAASMPIHWGRWFLFGALVALLGALWHFGRRYLRKLRRLYAPIAAPAPATPLEAPEAWLARELARVRARLSEAGENAAVLDHLVDEVGLVLRGYWARREKAPVEAWTTREFGRKFSGDQKAQALVPLFDKCDGWKFTGRGGTSPAALVTDSLNESERILLKCGT